jgi:predicted anti-sigma-YlaC factor YlaD
MKKCDEVQECISAYVDGESSDLETSALFFHLGECAECRAFMKSVLQLQSVLRVNELSVKIEAHPMTTSLWKRRFAVSYPIAAVVALLMLVSSFLLSSRMIQPPVTIKNTQTEYVYLTSFPPVVVVGSRPTEIKPN